MSWNSKVLWSEGLFLRPQHLQQADRYLEHRINERTRLATPYPWGFGEILLDDDLSRQGRLGLARASGVMPDGTPFDVPGAAPLPAPVEVPEEAAGRCVFLTLPLAVAHSREADDREGPGATRYVRGVSTVIDSTADVRMEEEIEIAHPRLSLEVGAALKPGSTGLAVARIVEVQDGTIVLDPRFVPPLLSCAAHPVAAGWIERVIGWIEAKLDELSRFAADPSSGGGLRSSDYFMLQVLNRAIPTLRHLHQSRYTHPERLYSTLIALAGELATFTTEARRARAYPPYDQDGLEETFRPVLDDIQRFLSAHHDTRAIRLELTEVRPGAFVSPIRDRSLFRSATFVLEVAARKPLTDIQAQVPNLLKVGPNTRMNEIVHANLPGIGLAHMPTPPPQIRALTDHVYFRFDPTSPLWAEFSTANAVGLHFAGDWPDLSIDLWAVRGDRAR